MGLFFFVGCRIFHTHAKAIELNHVIKEPCCAQTPTRTVVAEPAVAAAPAAPAVDAADAVAVDAAVDPADTAKAVEVHCWSI